MHLEALLKVQYNLPFSQQDIKPLTSILPPTTSPYHAQVVTINDPRCHPAASIAEQVLDRDCSGQPWKHQCISTLAFDAPPFRMFYFLFIVFLPSFSFPFSLLSAGYHVALFLN